MVGDSQDVGVKKCVTSDNRSPLLICIRETDIHMGTERKQRVGGVGTSFYREVRMAADSVRRGIVFGDRSCGREGGENACGRRV